MSKIKITSNDDWEVTVWMRCCKQGRYVNSLSILSTRKFRNERVSNKKFNAVKAIENYPNTVFQIFEGQQITHLSIIFSLFDIFSIKLSERIQ